jgi:diaminopimelate epimerase
MRRMKNGSFHKMHGLGNDFVIIDSRDVPIAMPKSRAKHIADRHTGIGCDQLIVLHPSTLADARMAIYNSDGGEVESCGNAARCVVSLLGHDCSLETAGGIIHGTISDNGVTVDMGKAKFEWQDIPLAFAMDSAAMPMAWESLSAPMAVNVGNPHAVFFVDDCDVVDLERLGPIIEHDAAFPDRVNVNVASVSNGAINLRVWERGVGLTRACGTGACATAVAAIRKGLAVSPVTVNLPGGSLTIAWQESGQVNMTGSATYVFSGEANWADFG